MKIFFSGRIPRDTGGSAAVSRPANAVRGIKYASCLHNRTHKAGGAHRRAFRGRHVHANPKIPQGFLHPENPSRRGAHKMERLRRDKKVRTCA